MTCLDLLVNLNLDYEKGLYFDLSCNPHKCSLLFKGQPVLDIQMCGILIKLIPYILVLSCKVDVNRSSVASDIQENRQSI